jgi:hypothetical protein
MLETVGHLATSKPHDNQDFSQNCSGGGAGLRRLSAQQFGGWPWKSNDPVHPRGDGRFARYIDGRLDRPG